MTVLVIGGSGLIGRAAVNALLAEGEEVRLLARGADEAAREWTSGVEPFPGDVGCDGALDGAADGCRAVLHVAGIAAEEAPDRTFEAINVQGTARALAEAARAGVARFVFVSSLGAERGVSDYHRSKRAAEDLVRASGRRWTVVRPGNVYGPGDEVISVVLRLVRTLPMVPTVHGDDRPFQPIWHEDLGVALARCCLDDALAERTLSVTGSDAITVNELLDRLGELTQRRPLRLPVPEWVARLGLKAMGGHAPVPADALTLLAEGSTVDAEDNALPGLLRRDPVGLAAGLARLVECQPEQIPEPGSGPLRRRVFAVEIEGATVDADALAQRFCADFNRFVPIDAAAERGSETQLSPGRTLTLAIPGHGHVQVRVEEADQRQITLATLAGHPLAGAVTFRFDGDGERVRFEVDEVSRAANSLDRIGMWLVGDALQGSTWNRVCESLVDESGGRCAGGVLERDETLDEDEATAFTAWLQDVVATRRREEENESGPNPARARRPLRTRAER